MSFSISQPTWINGQTGSNSSYLTVIIVGPSDPELRLRDRSFT